MSPKTYQDNFFDYHLQNSILSAKEVIPVVLEYTKPSSVIDVGCGVGTWLSVWQKSGIDDITGVDGNYVRSQDLLIPNDKFITSDLEKPFSLQRKFDLVSCLEVAEHIRPGNAEHFIHSICNLGDIVLFSAAIPGQEGTLHYNEQYPGYWIKLFEQNNFKPYDCIREQVWNNTKVSWWYRQNIMFFIRNDKKENYLSITNKKQEVLPMVHPELLKYKSELVADYEKVLRNPFTALRYLTGRFLRSQKILNGNR